MLPVALRAKELNGESYTLYWNLRVPSHVRMPGDLEMRLCLRSMRRNLEGGAFLTTTVLQRELSISVCGYMHC